MTQSDMKKEFKKRWAELFPGKRLLAVQLNGFTHSIFYDEKSARAKVVKGEVSQMTYSDYISKAEAIMFDMNFKEVTEFFKDFPNAQYQHNALEIVYVRP